MLITLTIRTTAVTCRKDECPAKIAGHSLFLTGQRDMNVGHMPPFVVRRASREPSVQIVKT
jgi:hypothetical protein